MIEKLSSYTVDILEADAEGRPILGYPLGLRHGYVRLSPHCTQWTALFEAEAMRIGSGLAEHVLEIVHYGSTAIPGIKAKPIIDILCGVASIENEIDFVRRFEKLGYDYAGRDVVPDHLIFGLGAIRTHLVHITNHGGESWKKCILVRDRLLADPELATEYEQFKEQLELQFGQDRAGYTAAKSLFVEELLVAGQAFVRDP